MSALVKVETRVCKKCGEEKPLARGYYQLRRGYWAWKCNKCINHQRFNEQSRECPKCHQVKPYQAFGRTRWEKRQECWECKPRVTVPPNSNPKQCPNCDERKSFRQYGSYRWQNGGPCMECTPRQDRAADPKRPHVQYDYLFARDVLEMSESRAIEWVMHGYGYNTIDGVKKQLPDKECRWEPDPV